MKSYISQLPENAHLTDILTVQNYSNNKRNYHIDIGPIIFPMNEVMPLLDNEAFSCFCNHVVVMNDRSEKIIWKSTENI